MRFLVIILALTLCPALAPAATLSVPPNGTAIFTVPASQFLNVLVKGSSAATVQKQVGYPNMVPGFVKETNGLVSSSEVSFGPYTNATVIRIDAGNSTAFYSVGTGGLAIPCSELVAALLPGSGSVIRLPSRIAYSQVTPIAKTTSTTLLAAELLVGLITGTHTAGSTQTYTLPTGTLLEAALPNLQIDEAFEWVLIDLSAAATDSLTLGAGTDHTIVGVAIVQSAHASTGGNGSGNAATWITRKTAAHTFVTYRKN